MTYAANTYVSVDRSKAEIEETLVRYGARKFAYAWDGDKALISFEKDARHIRFVLTLPSLTDKNVTHAVRRGLRVRRTNQQLFKAHDQLCRARWRALLLVLKAKMEAVASGIETFEETFLSHVVMPDGRTFGALAIPQIQKATDEGRMPQLLLGAGSHSGGGSSDTSGGR